MTGKFSPRRWEIGPFRSLDGSSMVVVTASQAILSQWEGDSNPRIARNTERPECSLMIIVGLPAQFNAIVPINHYRPPTVVEAAATQP